LHQHLSFRRLVGTGIGVKLLNDTNVQFFNPFLPIVAVGVGLDVVTLGQLVGLRSLMGLASPVFGSLGERRGFRTVVCISLLIEAAGLALIASPGGTVVLTAGMVLSGLGIAGFVPGMQAYASSHLPYERRARGLGMIEYSWALTGIVMLFLAGRLMEATSWRAPFVVLAVLMVVAAVVFSRLPHDRRSAPAEAGEPDEAVVAARALREPMAGLALNEVVVEIESERQPVVAAARAGLTRAADYFRLGRGARSAYAQIVAGALFYFAAFQVLLVHGTWLQDAYGLDSSALGTVALIFGVFDLVASVSVSLFTDRIGKRRSVLGGLGLGFIAYLLLPVLDRGLVLAVVGLTVARCLFEFTIVSHFPLLSEQVPHRRGKVLALATALGLVGSTAAGLIGPPLYEGIGVGAVAAVSAFAVLAAGVLVLLWVRERAGADPAPV
jgi:predicted MFS family arabinose efflux permease